ncbi:glycoside hydrolase family 32 protein [Pelosinus fermentans]|uniref:Sucrose-6-phosphate hydrolase n=1 Tax=Pelosinus fermentans JBW45 TaxID=1192197 RepID=I9NL49_9FIRM|nr:glycoside hydrolase family 32 protein [Pelosinus fermentans]AJQ28972.1 sucrose-6-phosphate hydrolase [Pelosinus fermentans JBW45]
MKKSLFATLFLLVSLSASGIVLAADSSTDVPQEYRAYNALDKANKAVWADYEKVRQSPFRLNYHIMAPTGWINDPNGLIQFKGQYHVFYQHYPYAPYWGPMHWGHVVSKDLVHWQYKPIALAPDQDYESGCWSGSAVDDNGVMTLFYTAHSDNRTTKELQCMATSSDGITFKKYEGNPVIRELPPDASTDFRDPSVWKHENMWYMLVGTGKDGKGRAVLYRSTDLRQWDYQGVAAESNGTQGDMWECPNLFSLGEKDVLLLSPMNMKDAKNIFIVGNMNYQTEKFTQQNVQQVDYGQDFYAGQTFQDNKGRRIMIGWMNRWGSKFPTANDGWAGALTVPRELKLSKDGSKVLSVPVEEMQKLRDTQVSYKNLNVSEGQKGYLKKVNGDSLEIKARIKLLKGNGRFGLIARESDDGKEKTLLYYDVGKREFVVDRSESGINDWNKETGEDYSQSRAKVDLKDDRYLDLQIFIDRSSIEVFVNDGEVVMSNRIYPNSTSIHYDLFAEGVSVQVEKLQAWKLLNGWIN